MRILGLGVPELIVLLLVIGIPVAVIVIVINVSKWQRIKTEQQKREVENSSPVMAVELEQARCVENPSSVTFLEPEVEQTQSYASRFPSGWYRDRTNPQIYRWWDGFQWSGDMVCSRIPYDFVPESPGWYKDPMRVGDLRWWDGQRWTEMTDGVPHSVAQQNADRNVQGIEKERYEAQYRRWEQQNQQTERENAIALQAYPVIANWKTSIGLSILGVLSMPAIATAATLGMFVTILLFLGNAGSAVSYNAVMDQAAILGDGLCSVLCICYALFIYPTFYKTNPQIKSRRLISFLNLLFGGILFGCLWNANLTRCKTRGEAKKDVSSIVYIVFRSALLALTLIYFALVLLPAAQDAKTSYEAYYSASAPYSSESSGATYADEALGLSFVVPEGWQEKELNEDRRYVKAKFFPSEVPSVGVAYGSIDLWGEMTPYERGNLRRSDIDMNYFEPVEFEGIVSDNLYGCLDETYEIVDLGGNVHFLYEGTGYLYVKSDDEPVHMKAGVLVHVENGQMVLFQYFAPTDTSYNEYMPDFLSFAASAVY